MAKRPQKAGPKKGGEHMKAVSIRLPAAALEAYRAAAGERNLQHTTLMREVLVAYIDSQRLRRLNTPRRVPEVNRESWLEMRDVSRDLHRVANALESARTSEMIQAARRLAEETSSIVAWFRRLLELAPELGDELSKRKMNPEALLIGTTRILNRAQRVNALAHRHLTTLPEQIEPELIHDARLALKRTMTAMHRVSLLLVGASASEVGNG